MFVLLNKFHDEWALKSCFISRRT